MENYKREELKNRIKELRNKKRMSQWELAEKASTTQTTISELENGKYEPSLHSALLIANALEVRVEDCFYFEKAKVIKNNQIIYDRSNFKNRIREIRKKKGISQKELAEKAMTTQNTISSLETGKYEASAFLGGLICAALECKWDEVFYFEIKGD